MMLKMYCLYCIFSFQGCVQMTSPYKKNTYTCHSSLPVKDGANISVQVLCNKSPGGVHQTYKCSDCEFAARQSSHLKYHTNSVHKGLKPFKCLECDYAASQSGNLKTHINIIHKGLKPFKCLECDFAAVASCHMLPHVFSLHSTHFGTLIIPFPHIVLVRQISPQNLVYSN